MAVIRALCFITSGVLLLLLLFSAVVSGSCEAGAESCAHFARTTLLIFGGGALVVGLVGVRLIGWEERQRYEEKQAAERLRRRRDGEANRHEERSGTD